MDRVDVVVIGGGIIGLCAARSIRLLTGSTVLVLDAGPPRTVTSSNNAGWITPGLSEPVPAPGIVSKSLAWMLRPRSPLYIRPRMDPSFLTWLFKFWRHCNAVDYERGQAALARLNEQTFALYDELHSAGSVPDYFKLGILLAFLTRGAAVHKFQEIRRTYPRSFGEPQLVEGAELARLEPTLSRGVAAGIHLPDERHVDPTSLMVGIATELAHLGVPVRSGELALRIIAEGGRALAVQTKTERLDCGAVVVCAGAWTSSITRPIGVPLPIEAGKGYVLDYAPSPIRPAQAVYLYESKVAVSPMTRQVRLAGTMELSGLGYRTPMPRIQAIQRASHAYFREASRLAGPKTGFGFRPLTPDGLPIIGALPGFENIFLATGHSMLGVTLAPATGQLVAGILSGSTEEDAAFAAGRFM